ncbi:unnamed protein product [Linum tenue]|uniref:Uncharacterized protein n=1 Tax=Linum tenue TaxID=586396 RepID=A0AAV0PT05_9ROSI|nr:unnamed protein product [Linum tenue]
MQWWLDELKGKASYQVIHGLFKRAWNLKIIVAHPLLSLVLKEFVI